MFLSSGVTITTIQLSTIIAIICMVVPLSTKKMVALWLGNVEGMCIKVKMLPVTLNSPKPQ